VRIVADESVDRQIVDRLRAGGHDIESVAELHPGIDDETVLELSVQSEALLLTADKDFGELVFRQRRLHTGVLLLRLSGLEPEVKAELVATTVSQHASALNRGFAVLSERLLRLRREGD
jgi:predicted nuclease of predicted toxin-antitoxin system